MDLALYTDSVPALDLDAALDLAVEIGAPAVEIAAGGQSSGPQVAIAGVLDGRSFDDPEARAWNFRTVGVGHGPEFWAAFVAGLRAVGYGGVLSIENEDASLPAVDGVRQAAAFMRPLLADA